VKKKTEKPRGEGTLTEAGFWGMIRSALRKRSMFWPPVKAVKESNRKPYKGPNKKVKWVYTCEACKGEFQGKEIDVDHIRECGSLTKATAGTFIERMFCEKDGLQILCKQCHKKKTSNKGVD